MRAGYLGPEGTYTHEALLASVAARGDSEPVHEVALATIHDVVTGVEEGRIDRGLVPIENSVEGSVNATLDALAFATEDVVIVGEVVLAIHHCLIARAELALEEIEVVVSHPQAHAQCARFVRERLPGAQVMTGASTAEAVRTVVAHDGPWAALGPRTAAERHHGVVLRAGVEDVEGNETRFAWLARGEDAGDDVSGDASDGVSGGASDGASDGASGGVSGGAGRASAFKTAIVFWPPVSDAPGWLVACLSELSRRGVNLTRIESRPRKVGLGEYVFFVDLAGRAGEQPVADGLEGVRAHVQTLRILGSFRAA